MVETCFDRTAVSKELPTAFTSRSQRRRPASRSAREVCILAVGRRPWRRPEDTITCLTLSTILGVAR